MAIIVERYLWRLLKWLQIKKRGRSVYEIVAADFNLQQKIEVDALNTFGKHIPWQDMCDEHTRIKLYREYWQMPPRD